MAEILGAKPKVKHTHKSRPARERVVTKELVSIQRSANAWAEERANGGSGILQQRPAVRSVPHIQRQST